MSGQKQQDGGDGDYNDRMRAGTRQRMIQQMEGDQPGDRARLLELAVDSDLEAPTEALENLKAKDFPLSNYDELADSWEVKGVQEILSVLDEARHPHPESILQGAVREYAFDDENESLEARSPEEAIENESFLLGTYSRFTRGEDGFQQETSAKQTREAITVDQDKDSSDGRLRSNIPGL